MASEFDPNEWQVVDDGKEGGNIELAYPAPDGMGNIATIENSDDSGAFTLWSSGELPFALLHSGVRLMDAVLRDLIAHEAGEPLPEAAPHD